MIDFETACKIVGNLCFFPGWEFTVENGADALWIGVRFDAQNSNRSYAPDYGMPLMYGASRMWPVEFGECVTEESFVDAVMRGVVGTLMHEACEFFRRGDRGYDAPYHPHRPEGVAAWSRIVAEPLSNFPDRF